ncbi:MAG: hypothetical protein AAB198_05180 [Actinomycetota bacterium]
MTPPAARAADIPLLGFSRLLIAGETEGPDAAEIEELAVTGADEKRHLGGFTVIDRDVTTTETHRAIVRFTFDPQHVVLGTPRPPR